MANIKSTPYVTSPLAARRGVLLGALMALAVPKAVSAATATAVPALPEELPELLALGEEMTRRVGAFDLAVAARGRAREQYEALRPELPAELIARRTTFATADLSQLAVPEVSVDGRDVISADGNLQRYIYDSRRMRAHIILFDVPRTTKGGRLIRRVARLATKYEQAIDAAERKVGYWDLSGEARTAGCHVLSLADELLALTPRAAAGVAILARAVLSMYRVDKEGHVRSGKAEALGVHLANTNVLQGGAK